MGAFATLKTEFMEDASNEMFKKLTLIEKSLIKSGFDWGIVAATIARVDEFRRTMPLVTDLHNSGQLRLIMPGISDLHNPGQSCACVCVYVCVSVEMADHGLIHAR